MRKLAKRLNIERSDIITVGILIVFFLSVGLLVEHQYGQKVESMFATFEKLQQ